MAKKYDSSKQPVEADKPKPPMNSSETVEHYHENKEEIDAEQAAQQEMGMVEWRKQNRLPN